MSLEDSVFDLLDAHIKRCVEEGVPEPETVLAHTYGQFGKVLKQRVGTSSGFTGLSEYLFFRYVLRYIEKRTNASFTLESSKRITLFRSPSLLLTHDANIARLIDVEQQRTDIAVFAPRGASGYSLLAAFELKIYFTSPYTLGEALDKFSALAQRTDALLFLILLGSMQYKREIDNFCQTHEGRAFVICDSALAYEHRLGLNEAIGRVLSRM
jgi:hypothetical protein